MRVFLVGAAGGVGARLARLLTERGDEVTGMHRDPAQAGTVAASGADAVTGDLIADSVADLTAKVAGHDVVVFSAGAHGTGMEQTTLIDGLGLQKMVDAAIAGSVARFVLVSVFPDAGRGGGSEAFEHYMRVKKTADVYLSGSAQDWLIVRPGTLLNTPGTGLVTAGPAVEYGDIPRDDVAAFIDAALRHSAWQHRIVEFTTGSTPVAAAAAAQFA